MKIKISVIVPVYKAEKTINRCINSILKQTYKNIELILIDDGSPDKSGKICDQYKIDSRVIVIHDKNRGVSHARNLGLQKASGDYITFCDSDDYYSVDHIEKMIRAAINSKSDITISGYYLEKTTGNFISSVTLKSNFVSRYDVIKHFTLDNEFGGFCWNKLYKYNVIKNVKFPENISIMEDTYFLGKVMKNATSIFYLAYPSYYYCNNLNSAVRNVNNLYSDNNTLRYLDSWKKILLDFKFSDKERELIYANMYKMAVNYQWLFLVQYKVKNKELIFNLNKNIKQYWKIFYKCKNISVKYKIKLVIKILFIKFFEKNKFNDK